MNTRPCTLIALLALLPAAAHAQTAPATASSPAVTLRYKFTPGDIARYRMTMDMNMNIAMGRQTSAAAKPIPPILQHMVMDYNTTVESVNPDGSASLTERITGMTMTMNGKPVPGMDSIANMYKGGIAMVMSPAGKVLSIKLPTTPGAKTIPGFDLTKIGNIAPAALPLAPVHIGDTWRGDADLASLGQSFPIPGFQMTLRSALAGISTDTRPIATINQTFKGILGGTRLPGPTGDMRMTGLMQGTTLLKFDIDNGSIAAQDGTFTMNNTTILPKTPGTATPMTMRMRMQMATHLVRLP